MEKGKISSLDVGRAALKIAVTASRDEENMVKQQLAGDSIRATAVDFGGEFISSIVKIVERAVVAAQRQGIVPDNHIGAGPVAGAASAALEQVTAGGFSPLFAGQRRIAEMKINPEILVLNFRIFFVTIKLIKSTTFLRA